MKYVTIKDSLFLLPSYQDEVPKNKGINKNKRPFVLCVHLIYKGIKYDFAVPFRSNIQSNKNTKGCYFALPRRNTTKPNRVHGLHIIKMFPVKNNYLDKYTIVDNPYNNQLFGFINKNFKKILAMAQQYLNEYESGRREGYCTNIDAMLKDLENPEN